MNFQELFAAIDGKLYTYQLTIIDPPPALLDDVSSELQDAYIRESWLNALAVTILTMCGERRTVVIVPSNTMSYDICVTINRYVCDRARPCAQKHASNAAELMKRATYVCFTVEHCVSTEWLADPDIEAIVLIESEEPGATFIVATRKESLT